MGSTAVPRRLRRFASGPALARVALAALAFALPFELEAPLTKMGPLALSSVELFLYAAVGLSAVALAVDRPRSWTGALVRHAAPLAWAAVVVLSAVRAPVEPQPALKFALRSLGGVMLYLAAASQLRTARALVATAVALALGAALAALLVWVEVRVPGSALLAPFHHRTFEVLGLPRASGPFQYPNIAAMYLEAALPVVLVLGAALDAGAPPADAAPPSGARRFLRRHRFAILTTAGAVWLGGAVLATASRAGIVTVAVVLGLLAVTSFWPARAGAAAAAPALSRRPLGWQAVGALGGLGVVWLAMMPSSPLMGLRMQYWRDPAWYQAAMTVVESGSAVPAAMQPGGTAFVTLRIQNRGAVAWPHTGVNRVAISYHWKDGDSEEIAVFDGVRTALPRELAPGEAATVTARIAAPAYPGRYLLLLDLVHEGVTWFGERGNPGLVSKIDVTPDASPSGAAAATAVSATVAGVTDAPALPPRTDLWKAAVAAWRDHPALGLGPDNFRLVYGRYLGLEAADERLHANSLYFETLASLGLLGVAALGFLVVAFWRVARRALAASGSTGPAGLLAPGLAAGLAAFLVHGLFDYFLEFTPTYGLAWLLGGMLVAIDKAGPLRESNRE